MQVLFFMKEIGKMCIRPLSLSQIENYVESNVLVKTATSR